MSEIVFTTSVKSMESLEAARSGQKLFFTIAQVPLAHHVSLIAQMQQSFGKENVF